MIPLSYFCDLSNASNPVGRITSSGLTSAFCNPLISRSDSKINFGGQIICEYRPIDLQTNYLTESKRLEKLGAIYGNQITLFPDGIGLSPLTYDRARTTPTTDMFYLGYAQFPILRDNDKVVIACAIKMVVPPPFSARTDGKWERLRTNLGLGVNVNKLNSCDVYNDYLYVSDNEAGVQIFNITDIKNPVFVSNYKPTQTPYVFASKSYDNYLYLATGGSTGAIIKLDVSNKASPIAIKSYSYINTYFRDLQISNDGSTIYAVGTATDELGFSGVVQIETTNMSAQHSFNNTILRKAKLHGSNLYCVGTRSIFVFSAPGLSLLRELPRSSGYAYDIDILDYYNYAYAAMGSAGLVIYDITDPESSIDETSNLTLNGNSEGICVIEDGSKIYAYVADTYAGVTVVDVTNPYNPVKVNQVNTKFHNQVVQHARKITNNGTNLFVACSDAVEIMDISNDMSLPVLTYAIPSGTTATTAYGPGIYFNSERSSGYEKPYIAIAEPKCSLNFSTSQNNYIEMPGGRLYLTTDSYNKYILIIFTFEKSAQRLTVQFKGGQFGTGSSKYTYTLTNLPCGGLDQVNTFLIPLAYPYRTAFFTCAAFNGLNDGQRSGLDENDVDWCIYESQHECKSYVSSANTIQFSCTGEVAWDIKINGVWCNTNREPLVEDKSNRIFYSTGTYTIAVRETFTELRPVLRNTGLLNADSNAILHWVNSFYRLNWTDDDKYSLKWSLMEKMEAVNDESYENLQKSYYDGLSHAPHEILGV